MPSYIQTGKISIFLCVRIHLVPGVYDFRDTISRYLERIQSKYQMQEK